MLSIVFSSWPTLAAPPDRPIQIGLLLSGIPERWDLLREGIDAGLRDNGYIGGKNVVVYPRTATYPDKRMAAHVDELIARNVDLIVTSCGWTTGLATRATKVIPIVMTTVADPVRRGFIKSLARPGGNVTGMTGHVPGLAPKMLEYIKIAVPDRTTVALLVNRQMNLFDDRITHSISSGASLGLKVLAIDVHRLATLDSARETFQTEGIEVVMGLPDDDLYWEYLDRVLAVANELRLPTFFPKREMVWSGAFMSLGADTRASVRRAGKFIDRILNGAQPGDLPVEHPTQIEFVINKAKAEQFGVRVPQAAMLRANVVVSK